jgi:cobalamin biosynthesis protein CobC
LQRFSANKRNPCGQSGVFDPETLPVALAARIGFLQAMHDSAHNHIADPDRPADHGGGIDAAVTLYGGPRDDWVDLSTGINPLAYPVRDVSVQDWSGLPDNAAMAALERAARRFWAVPDGAAVLAAPGASSLIARIPALRPPGRANILSPTYNEHARAFVAEGWQIVQGNSDAKVLVHPNNPDGRIWRIDDANAAMTIIDESFCDVLPKTSLIRLATIPGTIILKSFGKFWGLAGLRLGFAIGDPVMIARLAQMLGPWPVSGPALQIGTQALCDTLWADQTRLRLEGDAARLDALMATRNLVPVGGTSLFRLYDVATAKNWQDHLARQHIWIRIFPYNPRWIRLGLPGTEAHWARLTQALKDAA